ncbi:rRNA pseudouridine synthase [Candidatus Woesearchaeota archaeon]|nr:rRNA pseudouridine synthase [Candidatus Woesearchaeota archaeon]
MPQRLQKIIANQGYCSRRKAEELIQEGRVLVNGRTATIGESAEFEKDNVIIDGKPLLQTKKLYIMLNKSKKVVTTLYDPQGRTTVADILKLKERVIPIGRLDYMTEGLLLLTNDGDFANRIMHPRYEIKKTYHVTIDKPLRQEDEQKIRNGFSVEGIKTAPAKIVMLAKDRTKIAITIHEGRNRIIRNMMAELGYRIYQLERVSIGPLSLGNLPRGKWRELTEGEIEGF